MFSTTKKLTVLGTEKIVKCTN